MKLTPIQERLRETVREFPTDPGVYIMRDGKGRIAYVGKANRLRDRVSSYFRPSEMGHIRELQTVMRSIEYMVVRTEREALLLEANLIKQHRPRYNIRLKDDKSYPFIRITREDIPRLEVTRRIEDDGARYYGPYIGARVRDLVRLLQSLFGLRYCKNPSPNGCLYYHMNLCSGLCMGLITREEYLHRMDQAMAFLRGKNRKLLRTLKERMQEFAAREEFERAAALRDHITRLERVGQRQKVVLPRERDMDVMVVDIEKGAALVLYVRDGRVLGHDLFYLDGWKDRTPGDILGHFMVQYYGGSPIPDEVVTDITIDDEDEVFGLLSEMRASTVRAAHPQRGVGVELLGIARKNLASMLRQDEVQDRVTQAGRRMREKQYHSTLERLKDRLGLLHTPQVMECFDISHIAGSFAAASKVSFSGGSPDKGKYRRYRLKLDHGGDDYGAMSEALLRRFSGEDPLPDLVVIDGGPGQLAFAVETMEELGIGIPGDVDVISLAKREELVYLPDRDEPVALDDSSEELKLIQRIRDESHRFAVRYHRELRTKSMSSSRLDDISGIGPARKRAWPPDGNGAR